MDAEILLEWRIHPFSENIFRSVAIVTLIIILSVFVYISTGDKYLFGLSILILVGSLSLYLFPTKYQFTERYILVRNWFFWRTRKWDEFRNYIIFPRSVKLITLSDKKSRLNHYRGLLIILPENSEKIIEFIKTKIKLRA